MPAFLDSPDPDPDVTRASWEDLPPVRPERPPSYVHPWPTDDPYESRVYSGALGCKHFAFAVAQIKPGQSGTHRRYKDIEELCVLLDGRCQVMLDDVASDLKQFDAVRIPPHVARSFYNNTERDCLLVLMGAPVQEYADLGAEFASLGQDVPAPAPIDPLVASDPERNRAAHIGFDDMPVGAPVPRPVGYVHPWPTDNPVRIGRSYTVPLHCRDISFVVNRIQPGENGQHHCHEDPEEVFLIASGELQVETDGKRLQVGTLEAVRIGTGVLHSVANFSDQEAISITMGAPISEFIEPGLVRYHAANVRAFASTGADGSSLY